MADDPQSLGYNPFEISANNKGVPVEVILHIMSFLGRSDLLELALVDKRFNNIVTKSKETMRKIPLDLDFDDYFAIADVIILAKSRHFVILNLSHICMSLAASTQFMSLMTKLSKFVEDLAISNSNFRPHQFRWMMEIFLPKLLKCELFRVETPLKASTSHCQAKLHQSRQHPLKTLAIQDTDDVVTKFFTDCTQLKSLSFDNYYDDPRTDYMVTFLDKQTSLEKFDYRGLDLAWDRISCEQLKEVYLLFPFSGDEILAASDFLEKLQNLEKLDVHNFKFNHLRRMIEAICKLKKLVDLTISIGDNYYDNYYESLGGLQNRSVKRLRIEYLKPSTRIGPLLKVFHGVESIDFECETENLDLSNVPYEALEKIDGIKHNLGVATTIVAFSPTDEPSDVARFESAVLGFVGKFSDQINGITIGHENWLNNSNFSLTNGFCENLVTSLPNLESITIYNVEDPPSFRSFMAAIRAARDPHQTRR